jgi:glucose-1-phosphate cytidylyltransferase
MLKTNKHENKLPRPKDLKKMKVVILAGGLGTRISEYTKTIPKPMIKVCGKPIIHRIIDHYIKYGHKEFYIALGYKGKLIKNYFKKKI